jgi:hypothetical protein
MRRATCSRSLLDGFGRAGGLSRAAEANWPIFCNCSRTHGKQALALLGTGRLQGCFEGSIKTLAAGSVAAGSLGLGHFAADRFDDTAQRQQSFCLQGRRLISARRRSAMAVSSASSGWFTETVSRVLLLARLRLI